MRRKTARAVIAFFLGCMLAAGCTASEGSGTAENGESSEIEELSVVEKDWTVLQEELRPSVLQVFCGDYRASGVVWEITEEEVTVVSSGHLLKNGETCEVLCYAGIYYEARVDRILEDCDVGFAVIETEALKEDGVELTEVRLCGRGMDELVRGEELAVYGSMDYAAGNFVKGYLVEAEREIQFDGYESAQKLMVCEIVQDTGTVDAGMSGSGVFDRQGRLLGILSGGDGETGFAAVPVWEILAEVSEGM